jgi:hypothetical protein
MSFKPHFNRNLGTEVRSERERERLADQKGLADVRDWESKESLDRERARKFEAAREDDNRYLDKPIENALARASDGLPFEEALEREIREAEKDHVSKTDRVISEYKEQRAEAEERRAWEEKRGR